MTPAEMKLQCLTLAQGDTTYAQKLVDWVLDPLPADSTGNLTPVAVPDAPVLSGPGSQPPVPPSGTARR